MIEKIAYAGEAYKQTQIQAAYEATTDKWRELVTWIGETVGYEWILIAALIGMPFTIKAVWSRILSGKGGHKGETVVDVVLIIVMFLAWVAPPVVFAINGWTGGWWWVAWWLWVAVSLGITEAVSKAVTGRTISKHFWRWSARVDPSGKYVNKWKAVGTLALWTVAWGILMLHLGWKLITGRKYGDDEA